MQLIVCFNYLFCYNWASVLMIVARKFMLKYLCYKFIHIEICKKKKKRGGFIWITMFPPRFLLNRIGCVLIRYTTAVVMIIFVRTKIFQKDHLKKKNVLSQQLFRLQQPNEAPQQEHWTGRRKLNLTWYHPWTNFGHRFSFWVT